ncbi:MAG: hypothetical protein IJY59_07345 [Bacteroidaceae bacterium]|nr:hypothetical protein [Bacteroidaceae bacterium]
MKNIYISLLFIIFGFTMQAQTLPVDSLFSRMEQQALLYPSERLYLLRIEALILPVKRSG